MEGEKPQFKVTKLTLEEWEEFMNKRKFNILINDILLNVLRLKKECNKIFTISCKLNMGQNLIEKELTLLNTTILRYLQENCPYTIPDLSKYCIYFSNWGIYTTLYNKYFNELLFTYVEYLNKYVCPISFCFMKKIKYNINSVNLIDLDNPNKYISFGEIHIYNNGNIQLMGFNKIL